MSRRYSKAVHDHFAFEEGCRAESYLDTKGYWTIGIGHMLGKDIAFKGLRWSQEKIITVFENDLDTSLGHAQTIFPQFAILPPKVQLAILDMIFNLGGAGFRQFKTVIRMIHAQKYPEAAVAALDSKWARQDVPNRARRVAKLLSNVD
jgi:Phage-related lysozyme (muraminidase)